jgi:hypothetical protein
LYTPQLFLSLLTATSFSYTDLGVEYAVALHAIGWVAQFIGHGYAEKRAPALLDNLVGGMCFLGIPFWLGNSFPSSFGACALLRASRIIVQARLQAFIAERSQERYRKGDSKNQGSRIKEEERERGEWKEVNVVYMLYFFFHLQSQTILRLYNS